jgi:hypothetical protein
MKNGSVTIGKLETGFLVTVYPPDKKEEMFSNPSSCCQYQPPKEGAVSSAGEVLEVVASWLEKGDIDFKKVEPKEQDNKTLLDSPGRGLHDTYGQEKM